MKLSREVKTGIFAVLAILAFIMGYNFLKGSELFDTSRVFYAKYENVAGLSPASPVTVNGMQVGKVRDIYLESNRGGKVVVEFSIESDFKFSKSSTIQIYSSGFIGGNNLGVLPDYTTSDIAQSGDTLKGELQAGLIDGILEKFTPLQKSIFSTLSKLDSVLIDINEVLDERTKENLRGTIANLNSTMRSFDGAASSLNTLLSENQESLDNTFENLEVTTGNFARFSDSLAQLEVGQLVNDLEGAIGKFDAIMTKIEKGDGSVSKLLNDEQLYENLEGASRQLEQLLQDVKLNPKRYVNISVFGKKQKEYESPKDPDQ